MPEAIYYRLLVRVGTGIKDCSARYQKLIGELINLKKKVGVSPILSKIYFCKLELRKLTNKRIIAEQSTLSNRGMPNFSREPNLAMYYILGFPCCFGSLLFLIGLHLTSRKGKHLTIFFFFFLSSSIFKFFHT